MPTNQAFSQRLFYQLVRGAAPLLLLVAGGALRDSRLHAQTVQLRPLAGLHLPSRISVKHGSLDVLQKVGVTVGAGLTLTFNQRFAVVTRVTYTPGYAMFRGTGKQMRVGTVSHLLTATTGGRYWLLPPARMLSWEVYTGFGVGFGGQPAYADLFESSAVSGILGTTVRCQISRVVKLHLRVQERLYRVRFGGGPNPTRRPPLQISFGLGLPLVESTP